MFIATYIYDYFSITFTPTLIAYDEYKKYIRSVILLCHYRTTELRYYKNEIQKLIKKRFEIENKAIGHRGRCTYSVHNKNNSEKIFTSTDKRQMINRSDR